MILFDSAGRALRRSIGFLPTIVRFDEPPAGEIELAGESLKLVDDENEDTDDAEEIRFGY